MVDDALERAKARLGNVLNEKWTLERLLGLGGMAAVYAGVHRNGARAAVKLLHPDLARNAEVRERFLREGYAANKVDHPGAVQVLDDDVVIGGPDDGTAYLVMELLDGESVDAMLQAAGKPLAEDLVLAIADDVLAVLEAAHPKGIIHRDIKPENLFVARVVDRDGADVPPRVKVLDFGLARLTSSAMNTRIGMALGTPSFMAPEQAAGRNDEIDARSDLFAVGATMFRLLSGARIHDGANSAEIVSKMATIPAPSVRSVAPNVSEDVAAIVDRALQFQPIDRYDDATSMRAAVQLARRRRDADAIALGSEETISDPHAVAHAATSPALSPPSGMRSPPPASSRRAPRSSRARVVEHDDDYGEPSRTRPGKKGSGALLFGLSWVLAVVFVGTAFFVVRDKLLKTKREVPGGLVSGRGGDDSSDLVGSSTASSASSSAAIDADGGGGEASVSAIASTSTSVSPSAGTSVSASASASDSAETLNDDDDEGDDDDAGVPPVAPTTSAAIDGGPPKIIATNKPPQKKPTWPPKKPGKKKKHK